MYGFCGSFSLIFCFSCFEMKKFGENCQVWEDKLHKFSMCVLCSNKAHF